MGWCKLPGGLSAIILARLFLIAVNNPELEKEYQTILPHCESFANELIRQLKELLSQEEKISSEFIFQYRIKHIDSMLQAIESKSMVVKSILEFDDLIGLRVILTFKREADLVCELIRKNLKVLVEKDIQAKLGEREFGYSSVHFIAEPPPTWQSMPTFKKAAGFRAEIQVRSGAQHIWASASRVLQYRQEQNVPPPVRRAINRVSALLEMADLEFERVLTERASYVTNVKTDSASEELNVDLLAKILDEELPPENKSSEGERYSMVLPELIHFSFNTPQKLRALLEKHKKAIESDEAKSVQRCKSDLASGKKLKGTPIERIHQGVYYTHIGLTRVALRHELGNKWREYVESNKKAKRQLSKT